MAFGCWHAKTITVGWLPSPRHSHTERRPNVSPSSSSTMSIVPEIFSRAVHINGWTCWSTPWRPPAWQSFHCIPCTGQQGWRSGHLTRWGGSPLCMPATLVRCTLMLLDCLAGFNTPRCTILWCQTWAEMTARLANTATQQVLIVKTRNSYYFIMLIT